MYIVMSMGCLAAYIQLINVLPKGSRSFKGGWRNSLSIFTTRSVLSDFHVVYIITFYKQYVNDGSIRRRMGDGRKTVATSTSIRM